LKSGTIDELTHGVVCLRRRRLPTRGIDELPQRGTFGTLRRVLRCTDAAKAALHPEGKMRLILLIVVIILLIGALPAWPYSTSWGYYPAGGLGTILIIIIILLLLGVI
jgi:hypothetical protein